MGRISVNTAVEPVEGADFCPVKPGVYVMRVAGAQEKISKEGKPYISWRLEHTLAADQMLGLDGKPITGTPGGVFHSTRTDQEKQGMLRAFVQAVLGEWREFDTEELFGKELTVSLGTDTYEGKTKNTVGRIVKAS